jgi:hypothetical protein
VKLSLESAFQYLVAPGVVALIVIVAQYFLLPKIESEKARATQLFQHKREVCLDAIRLVDKHINAQNLSGLDGMFQGHKPGVHVPTDEINSVLAQLILSITDEKDIPNKFVNFFGPTIAGDVLVKRGEFILSLRREIYNKKYCDLSADKIGFYYNRA